MKEFYNNDSNNNDNDNNNKRKENAASGKETYIAWHIVEDSHLIEAMIGELFVADRDYCPCLEKEKHRDE